MNQRNEVPAAGATDASRCSIAGLNGVNFFVANMLTGFGPFMTVYLAASGWGAKDIGFALSVGTIAAVAWQVPAGLLMDAVPHKRLMAGIAIAGVMVAAVVLATLPQWWPVLGAEALQGMCGSLLTPAIAAMTLALCRQERLGERLGSNVRFQALGSMSAALLMGYIGSRAAPGAVLSVAAGFGGLALGALLMISERDLSTALHRTGHLAVVPRHRRIGKERRRSELWRDPRLLIFAICMLVFQFGNASVLPFSVADLQHRGELGTDTVVAYALVVSQVVVALISKPLGKIAQLRGRRMALMLAFAALTVRCSLLSVDRGRVAIILLQVLDGFSGAAIGVMVPLVVADITRHGGRFNLAMGTVGLAMTAGATLSTTVAGLSAEHIGLRLTFVLLGSAGVVGAILVLFALPETRAEMFTVDRREASRHAA